MEEYPDVRIKRRAARNQRLDPPAKLGLNLGAQGFVDEQVHRLIPKRDAAAKILGTKRKRAFEQPLGELTFFLNGLDHPCAQHFEEARHNDH